MARGKARFRGEHRIVISDHQVAVRAAAVKAIPGLAGADYVGLVEELEAAAWKAAWMVAESAVEDHRRDQHAELEKLRHLIDKQAWDKLAFALERLSPDVWAAFQVNGFELSTAIARPMEFRQAIEELLTADLPAKRRDGRVLHVAGLTLAKRVYSALAPHAPALGITLSGHGRDHVNCSPMVKLLYSVGDCIGLAVEPTTWRDYLVEVRKNGEDAPIRG